MSKFPKTALEEFVEGSVDLSPEESKVIVDESNVNAAEVESRMRQVRRLSDVRAVLEDLAVVATRIERASPTELRLIESASDMAAAGTSIAPQNFVPAVEQYLGKRISTESWTDKAKQILKVLLDHMAAIWEKLEDFFKLAFIIPNIQKGIKSRLDWMRRMEDPEKVKTTVQINSQVSSLRVGGLLGKDPQNPSLLTLAHIETNAENYTKILEYVYEDYLKASVIKGADIYNSIKSFDLKAPEKEILRLTEKLRLHDPDIPPGAKTKPAIRLKDKTLFTGSESLEFFGDNYLILARYEPENKQDADDALRQAKRTKVTLEHAQRASPQDISNTTTMSRLKPDEIKSILKIASEYLGKLQDFYIGREYKAVREIRRDVEKACKEAVNELDNLRDSTRDMAGPDFEKYFRALIDLNPTFAGWIQSPAVDMYRRTISIVQTLLIVADAQLATYQSKQ